MAHQTATIVTGLGTASASLGEAQQRIAAGRAKADEVATQAGAELGMHAVAQQLRQVGEVLQEGHELVGASAHTLSRATSEAGEVHAGMNPGDVIEHLTAASGLIDVARTEMFAGLDRLDKAVDQAHAALLGAQPGPLVNIIETVKQSIRDLALREANTAQDAISALITTGGHLGK